MRLKPIPVSPTAPMEDARRHPGCRMLIYCRRRQWISTLAWPETLDAREAKRLAGVYRN